ncbi:hypothetical protein CONCODRAFT_80773, partial [Conidiobolus coronatus NRRL 28638]
MTYSRSLEDVFNKDSSKISKASLPSIVNPVSPLPQQQPSASLPTMIISNKSYPPWVKSFKCSICSKSYNRKNSLQRHMRIHSGAKPYECDNCSKSFTRKDILEKHKESMKCQRIRKIHNQSSANPLSSSDHSSILAYETQYSSPQVITSTTQCSESLPHTAGDYIYNNNSSFPISEPNEDTIPSHPLLSKDMRFIRDSSPLQLPSDLLKYKKL